MGPRVQALLGNVGPSRKGYKMWCLHLFNLNPIQPSLPCGINVRQISRWKTWISFDILCLLLIKAIFCLLCQFFPFMYLLFSVFAFLLISIYVLYWNIKCLFFFLLLLPLLLWIATLNFVTENNSNFCIFMFSYVWWNADEKG